MSDRTRWQQIKDKCAFDNGELIQVCFADEEITRLTEQLAESQRQNKELRDLCMEVYSDHKAPDMPMIGYNECEKDKCDWCARLDKALQGRES